MKKRISRIFILFVLLSPLLISCLNTDNSSDYTAEKEQELLQEYLAGLVKNGYNVDTTSLGVYYVRITAGTGSLPVEGDTLSVKYVGYLMDGSVFNHSFYSSADSSWTYIHKKGNRPLPAWEEMMELMNKGTRMEFIVPSSLAYGATGADVVPPYSSLIFVAIMKDIKKNMK